MALSRHIAYGDGSNRIFGVPFPYINKSHVKVYVGNSESPAEVVWLSATQFQLAEAPANNEPVRIIRNTPKGSRLVSFNDGSRFPAQVANLDSLQMLFILQEIMEGTDIGGALSELQGLVGAATVAAAEAANSAASITLPLPLESGGTSSASAQGARTALGLTSAAVTEIGSSPGNLIVLDSHGRLPSLSAVNLTDVPYNSKAVVKELWVPITERLTVSGPIPIDDTRPLITEGGQVWAGDYAPSASGNIIEITYSLFLASASGAITVVASLFDARSTEAVSASLAVSGGTGWPLAVSGSIRFAASSTDTIPLALRAGGGSSATSVTINGTASARHFGEAMVSFIKITEYKA